MTTMDWLIYLYRDVMMDRGAQIARETSFVDLGETDRRLLVAGAESHFKVRFSPGQVQTWQRFGDICDAVNTLQAAAEPAALAG
jgi:hypothetical protein